MTTQTPSLDVAPGTHGTWWVISTLAGVESMGPYSSRDEAERTRVRVERTLRALDRDDDQFFRGPVRAR